MYQVSLKRAEQGQRRSIAQELQCPRIYKPYASFRFLALYQSLFETLVVLPQQCILLAPIDTLTSSGKLDVGIGSKVPLSLYGHRGRIRKCNAPRSQVSEVRHFRAKSRIHLLQSQQEWVGTSSLAHYSGTFL